ncbi:hypothetical protein BA190_06690 [Labrys sp. WJW]|nr:hypothetical protein BA190_06690 [Labrys sp. WJW]
MDLTDERGMWAVQDFGQPLDVAGFVEHATVDIAFDHQAHLVGRPFRHEASHALLEPAGSPPTRS